MGLRAPDEERLDLVEFVEEVGAAGPVTIAGLSLPRLNADIIDIGVVAGDTDYILRAGSRRGLAGAVVAGHAGAVLPPSGNRAAGLDDERYVSLVR